MKAKKAAAKAKRISSRKTTVAQPARRAAAPQKITRKAAPKAAAQPQAAKRKVIRRPAAVKIPPLLLEGDAPAAPPVSGPGAKYVLAPAPLAEVAATASPVQSEPTASAHRRTAPDLAGESAALPEAYGTKGLFLTARDPHWLYAHWDLTREQQSHCNRQSLDGHLILRIHFAPPAGGLALEVHVHPESRHWFTHVERAGAPYTAELGYYSKRRQWRHIARSGATLTPPETISGDIAVEFATIPADLPFEQLLALVKATVQSQQPLALAVAALRREGHPDLPAVDSMPAAEWTPAQERALAEVVSLDPERRVWISSLEIRELLRRQLHEEVSSQSAAQLGRPTFPAGAGGVAGAGGGVTSVSIPFGAGPAREKDFWFNVNAELIIYGATERDATVSIGGRQVKLRPDGSFSYRFALPDGRYDLPVVAVSADATDGRGAELRFTRTTELRGDVGASPQDPALNPPTPDEV